MQSFPLNQNMLLFVRQQDSTHIPRRTVDATTESFAIHKIFCLNKILLRLTEVLAFVEATQEGTATSHLWHSFL